MWGKLILVVFLLAVVIRADLVNLPDGAKEVKSKITDEWVVKLEDGIEANELAHEHGFRNMGPVGDLKGYYLFKKLRTKSIHPPLKTASTVIFHERQVKRMRYKRNVNIKDPLYNEQWHLHNTKYGLNTLQLWNQGIMGENITIAIVDDGLETNNKDISVNYNARGSWDFNDKDADPTPFRRDEHGTNAAGAAAAPMNTFCGVGVAPKAKVSGIRLIAKETTDAEEAAALSYKTQLNDIFTNSWGPYDDGHRYEGPGPVLKSAFEQSIKEGRGGKGTIYVWASGNGRSYNDNCNYDGYSNNRYTIAIGSITDSGVSPFYSEPCAALIAVTPSSGGKRGIPTTTLNYKMEKGECNKQFGGTSASAPMAAGAIALMLGVNPNLTWRDVQHILVRTSKVIDRRNSDWWKNEAGLMHNHNFGFGLISPVAAVELSRNWTTVPTYVSYQVEKTETMNIPEGTDLKLEFKPNATDINFIEHIEVTFSIFHERKGQLSIILTNEFGTKSLLSVPHEDYDVFPEKGWTYGSVRHWGEKVNQKWTLIISDTEGDEDQGKLHNVQLKFFGHKKL